MSPASTRLNFARATPRFIESVATEWLNFAGLDQAEHVEVGSRLAALRELAGQLPEIGQLTVTPDVLTGLLARFGAGSADR